MSRHKLPLLTVQTIFQWPIRSQQRNDFVFSDTSDCLRETALNDLKSKLGISNMVFVPRHINWLPDNKPTLAPFSFYSLPTKILNSNLIKALPYGILITFNELL